MRFEFPTKGDVSILNKGEAYGNIYSTYGIDYSTEPGRILNSPACVTHLSGYTTATLASQAIAFLPYNSKWWAIADDIYSNNSLQDPTSGWAIDATASTPQVTVSEGDACIFDSAIIVSGKSGGGDLARYDGSWNTTWWTGTLAQVALNTGFNKVIKTGPNGRLYILDNLNKVYNVTAAGVVTKTGNGTLDMSAAGYAMTCMVMSSNRMWLGGRNLNTGLSVVVEWDMSLNESSFLKSYHPGGTRIVNILIWNDSPVLMLADGSMRFYDGSRFFKKDGAHIYKPKRGETVYGDYTSSASVDMVITELNIHPNGSAVIDEMPHYLLSAKIKRPSGTNYHSDEYKTITGIFCYDPEKGLYNRYPIDGASGTTGFGSEASAVGQMGALISVPSAKTSFLASAMIRYQTDVYSLIFSDDKARTLASRGRFILNPFYGSAKDLWQKVEVLATRLKDSSDRILLKYRLSKHGNMPFKANITWVNSTSFTSTDTNFQYVSAGDLIIVAEDLGGNCTSHVSSITYSNPTYTVTIDEAATGVTTPQTGVVRVDNFKRLATISNQKTDFHEIDIPTTEGSHTLWLMVELRAAAGSVVELDKIVTTSKEGK